ncbi:MAG: hypothetical protein WC223_11065 [Bacteroidales bacterium]|jgi:hypothetical protein
MKTKQIGFIVMIIGIAFIIISQSVKFTKKTYENTGTGIVFSSEEEDTRRKNVALGAGIIFLIGGGVLLSGIFENKDLHKNNNETESEEKK